MRSRVQDCREDGSVVISGEISDDCVQEEVGLFLYLSSWAVFSV